MPTVVARPDDVGAVIARLGTFSQLVTLTSGRIGGELKDAWPMPCRAVIVRRAGGPPPADPNVPILFTRLDVFCYGSSGIDAASVFLLLDSALAPSAEGQPAMFTQGNCRFLSIVKERWASTEQEEDSKYDRVSCTYIGTYLGVPVS